MALLKFEKGLEQDLFDKRPNTEDGAIYFTTDTGKLYIDIQDGINTGDNEKIRRAVNAL